MQDYYQRDRRTSDILLDSIDMSRLEAELNQLWTIDNYDDHRPSSEPVESKVPESMMSDDSNSEDDNLSQTTAPLQPVEIITPRTDASSPWIIDAFFYRPNVYSPVPTCTLHFDMTQEDRDYFINMSEFRRDVSQFDCTVNLKTFDNDVSIFGHMAEVKKVCEYFNSKLLQSIVMELRFKQEEDISKLESYFNVFAKNCQEHYRISFEKTKFWANIIQLKFTALRNKAIGQFNAISELTRKLQFFHLSKSIDEYFTSFSCIFHTPAGRHRDLVGRNNAFIEDIQNKTQTKIEITRGPQFDRVKITGTDCFSLEKGIINARLQVVSRFNFRLKFQVFVQESSLLEEYIVKKISEPEHPESIQFSIEPDKRPDRKLISIIGTPKDINQLFKIAHKLDEDVNMYNRPSVENFSAFFDLSPGSPLNTTNVSTWY